MGIALWRMGRIECDLQNARDRESDLQNARDRESDLQLQKRANYVVEGRFRRIDCSRYDENSLDAWDAVRWKLD